MTDKTWENCKKIFKDYYQAKKRFGSTHPTNHGFESVANLNEVQDEEMKLMERNHDSEQINAMAKTTNSMVELCAKIAVAKAEQGTQIAELKMKIDLLTKMSEKLVIPTPKKTTTTRRIGNITKCEKRHEKGICWEDKNNAANRPPNWKLVKP